MTIETKTYPDDVTATGTAPLPDYSPEARAPYPFCCHKEKCIPVGRCMRTVGGEPWCCAD